MDFRIFGCSFIKLLLHIFLQLESLESHDLETNPSEKRDPVKFLIGTISRSVFVGFRNYSCKNFKFLESNGNLRDMVF